MEHICFEVQLCIKISILKEKYVFDILIILCLMTSLSTSMMNNQPTPTPASRAKFNIF